jgi:hypothetical protein
MHRQMESSHVKKLSSAALAAILIAGTSSMAITTPAFAKKDEKPTGPKLSNEVRTPAIAAQTALAAKDYAAAGPQVSAVEAAAKTDDERYLAQVLRLQLTANQAGPNGNEAAMAPMLDALLANPATPKAELGRFTYLRANMAYNAKQYPQALAGYVKARDLGYTSENLPLQIARTKIITGDSAGGASEIEAQIAAAKAAGKPVDEDLYKYTISSLQKTPDTAATLRWTRDWLYAYPTQKNWHTAIYVFGFQGANARTITKKQRLDLFRLLRATDSLTGENEYLEYAQLAVDVGVASEAQTVIAAGKASGKIPAASANAKLILAEANGQVAKEGSIAAQEKSAAASSDGLNATGAGDFSLGQGNYAKAIELYKMALAKGGAKVDKDEVNTRLGIAYLGSGDKAQAKQAFGQVTNGLRGQIALLWSYWADAPGKPTAA